MIDLYLIHRPDLLTPWAELAETLMQLVDSGKVKQIGVSNFTASQFEALQSFIDIPLVSHQPEVSLVCPDVIEGGLMNQWQQYDAVSFCWSPLAGGALATGNCPDGYDAARFAGIMTVLDEKAAKYGVTRSQMAYAFVLALPGKVVPLVGSGKPERITEAVGSLDIRLEKPDWYDLYVAARGEPMP